MKNRLVSTVAALGLAAFAQTAAAEIIEGKTEQDRRFIAGGVGLEEAQQMRQQAAQFPLKVTFAHPSGAFLANTEVRIRDQRGNVVLDKTVDAPMLLVDVPAGTYTIEADNRGQKQQRRVNIGPGARQQVVMSFNVPVDEPGTTAQVPSAADVLGQQREQRSEQKEPARGTSR